MTAHPAGFALAVTITLLSLGCVGNADYQPASNAPATVAAPRIPPAVFASLAPAAKAHADLCADDGLHPRFPDDADALTRALCQDVKPGGVAAAPASLAELQALLGLGFADPAGDNGSGGNPAFALTGHSSSLVARFVSAINPRAIVFTPPPADGSKPVGYVVLAFTRGEQLAEVAAHDPTLDVVNFYLVRFEQACTAGGCSFGDLLTSRVETGWSNVRAYESSTAINDTLLDCRQCHQPDSSQPQLLRMHELAPPYTHFFSNTTVGGQALLADFHAAHGYDEDYGPVPAAMIDRSDPAKLSALVTAAGFGAQPNAFDSAAIEQEVLASAPYQPAWNAPPGKSATWQTNHQLALDGQAIAAPYHDVKISDPAKLAQMTHAYQQVRDGSLPPESLPDIRAVFLDDGLRDMGFAPAEGATGTQLLTQVCHQCHNSKLDQTVSRAAFDVDTLASLSRTEKDAAIGRLKLDADQSLKMPPPLFRTLTDEERDALIAALSN